MYYGGPMIADFDRSRPPGVPLSTAGRAGAVGLLPGLREEVARRLAALSPYLQQLDPLTQAQMAEILDRCIEPHAVLTGMLKPLSDLCDSDLVDPPLALLPLLQSQGESAPNLQPIVRYSRFYLVSSTMRSALVRTMGSFTPVTDQCMEILPEHGNAVESRVIEVLLGLALSEYEQVRNAAGGTLDRLCKTHRRVYTVVIPRLLAAVRGEWDGQGSHEPATDVPLQAPEGLRKPLKGPVLGALAVLQHALRSSLEPFGKETGMLAQLLQSVLVAGRVHDDPVVQRQLLKMPLLLVSFMPSRAVLLQLPLDRGSRSAAVEQRQHELERLTHWVLAYVKDLQAAGPLTAAANGHGDANGGAGSMAALLSMMTRGPRPGAGAAAAQVAREQQQPLAGTGTRYMTFGIAILAVLSEMCSDPSLIRDIGSLLVTLLGSPGQHSDVLMLAVNFLRSLLDSRNMWSDPAPLLQVGFLLSLPLPLGECQSTPPATASLVYVLAAAGVEPQGALGTQAVCGAVRRPLWSRPGDLPVPSFDDGQRASAEPAGRGWTRQEPSGYGAPAPASRRPSRADGGPSVQPRPLSSPSAAAGGIQGHVQA